jgi:RimJ/RimL family protein N-acetyltransferase
MHVLEAPRVRLRRLTELDAGFICSLLNQPSFIRYIGDRGVRSDDDARRYIREGPMTSYSKHDFGLYLVELKHDGAAAGICGLLKRESLEDVDLGFAFLPEYWSKGYAWEASCAVLEDAERRGLTRVLAITSPDNEASIRLLRKLGFLFERTMRQPTEATDVRVFAWTADAHVRG